MEEGETRFNPGDMDFKDIEQNTELVNRFRAVMSRLTLDRRGRLLQEGRELDDVSSGPGSGVQDTWASMPDAGKDFHASLDEEEGVIEEVRDVDEDPMDFSDLPVF